MDDDDASFRDSNEDENDSLSHASEKESWESSDMEEAGPKASTKRDDDDDSNHSAMDDSPPAMKEGTLEFTLNNTLQSQFVCDLCLGYLREPYRITTCLHVFCKSCLLLAIERAGHNCPTCNGYLGRLAKEEEITFQPDRLLHHLMDKVLFPHVAQADDQAESEFYASLGIPPKTEYREKSKNADMDDYDTPTAAAAAAAGGGETGAGDEDGSSRMISFQLVPSTMERASSLASSVTPTPLQRPFLETESALTIAVLKKYLQEKEKVAVSDIYCLGTVLGNEWSIDFVNKTLWRKNVRKRKQQLVLEYRQGGSSN